MASEFRQFDSCAPAQNRDDFDATATRNYAEYESRNRTGNTLYMLKTQKPLSWFLLAFLAEKGRRYSTDFDGGRYWFLASQPCCGGRNRTGVWGLWAPRGTSPLPRYSKSIHRKKCSAKSARPGTGGTYSAMSELKLADTFVLLKKGR